MTRRPGPHSMSDQTAVSRRSCVHGAIALAIGTPLLGFAGAGPVTADDKVSKKLASYQDQPKGKSEMCATCKYFLSPASCAIVEGTISPQGWCQRYQKRS